MINKKSKILHLSTVHAWNDVRILYRECTSLAANGYDVTLMIPKEKPEVVNGVKIIPLPLYESKLARFGKTNLSAIGKLFFSKYDVIHFHDPELIPLGLLAKLQKKRVIFDVHENLEVGLKEKSWVKFRPAVEFLFERFVQQASKHLEIVVAEKSYESFWSRMGADPILVMNFPELSVFDEYRTDRDYDYPRLFYIGGVTEQRGALLLLEALKLLKDRGQRFHFYCVGPIDSRLESNSHFQSLKKDLSDNCTFYGRLNLKQGYEVSKKCNLGLAVLLPIQNYLGSYPTKLFEYMSVGLPYLTSSFPLYEQLTQDTQAGFTVSPTSSKDVADRIESLFSDSDKLERAGKSGPETARTRYNWKSEERKLLDLYERVVQ